MGGNNSLILEAAAAGATARVAELLTSRNRNARDATGKTLLHLAVESRTLETVELLLAHKANVSARTREEGIQPVHLAALLGPVAVLDSLLAKGAKVGSLDRSPQRWNPLFYTVRNDNEACARVLIENGAPVNAKDAFGATALHYAAQAGQLAVTQVLLEYGADVDSQDASRATPLHEAASRGHVAVVKVLVEASADLSLTDQAGKSAGDLARENHREGVDVLLKSSQVAREGRLREARGVKQMS